MIERIYKDSNYSIEERAENLLSLMTLDEKIDQLHVQNDPNECYRAILKNEAKHNFGALFLIYKEHKKILPKIQKHAMENTRLGIPMLFVGEGLHGYLYEDAVIFPQNIATACSFNEKSVYEMAKEVGRSANSTGIRQVFAPNLDIAREARWGRTQETYGEDPYLAGKLSSAYVRGVQEQGVAATLKHYIGYSAPDNGLNLSRAHLGEREIRETMLPPYEECVKAGAMSVMPAYNEIDGEPLHSSKKWLRDVLRGELGFDGVIVSDWGGINWLHSFHKIVKSDWETGKYAIEAGVDVEAPDYYGYGDAFKEKIRKGEIPEKLVDEAVLRVLKLKFRLGLFDGKAMPPQHAPIRTKKAVRLARKIAEQSITLLKNDGILPLDITKREKVAIIGPNADVGQVGDYCEGKKSEYIISPLQGLINKIGKENVIHSVGSGISQRNGELLSDAVKVAQQADVVILALGDNIGSGIKEVGGVGGGGTISVKNPTTDSEGFDVSSLVLPESQRELFEAVAATGKPLITVLYTGYQRVIVKEYKNSNAFIQAWYPGEQGGNAFADILYGDVNPSAKLAVSLPQSDGHLPCYYNYRVSSRGSLYRRPGSLEQPGRDYVFSSPDAFLPFGFGLSYTDYEYSELKVKRVGAAAVEVKISVQNIGKRDGEEIVLVFLKSAWSESVPFEKQLKAFRRVALKVGQKKTIRFILDDSAFTIIGRDYAKKVNYGKHFVFIGDQQAVFEL